MINTCTGGSAGLPAISEPEAPYSTTIASNLATGTKGISVPSALFQKAIESAHAVLQTAFPTPQSNASTKDMLKDVMDVIGKTFADAKDPNFITSAILEYHNDGAPKPVLPPKAAAAAAAAAATAPVGSLPKAEVEPMPSYFTIPPGFILSFRSGQKKIATQEYHCFTDAELHQYYSGRKAKETALATPLYYTRPLISVTTTVGMQPWRRGRRELVEEDDEDEEYTGLKAPISRTIYSGAAPHFHFHL